MQQRNRTKFPSSVDNKCEICYCNIRRSCNILALQGHSRSLIILPCTGQCMIGSVYKNGCMLKIFVHPMKSSRDSSLCLGKKSIIVKEDDGKETTINSFFPIAIGNADALAYAAAYRAHCIQKAMDDLAERFRL